MKSFLIIQFCLIFYSVNCISQNTWEYYDSISEFKGSMYFVYENQNEDDFISLSTVFISTNTVDEDKNYSLISFHDKASGKVKKQIKYKKDSLATNLELMLYDKKTEKYIIAGKAHKFIPGNNKGYFLLTEWDRNFNLIHDTLIPLFDKNKNFTLTFLSGIIDSHDKYIFIINCASYNSPDQAEKFTLFKVSNNCEIVSQKTYFASPTTSNYCSVIENNEKNGYILLGRRLMMVDSGFGKTDSLTTFGSIRYALNEYYNSRRLSSNTFLCSVRNTNGDHKGLGIFNDQMNLLNEIDLNIDNEDYITTFYRNHFDFIDTSSIFIGTQDFFYSYFTIAKVNSKLYPKWIKYMSVDDQYMNFLIFLTCLSDGGVIISGNKASYLLKTKFNSWALKLDSDGNTVSTKDTGSKSWEITVFPNPSSGDFKIDIAGQPNDTKLVLYDIQGREVKRYKGLDVGTNTFFFDDLTRIIHGMKEIMSL